MILVAAPDAPGHDASTGQVHVFLLGATQYIEAFR
jgi:hypothetical protein